MLFAISPAKALDYETPPVTSTHTPPLFIEQSAALIDVLKSYSPEGIAGLMHLSDKLAGLNVARYQAWSTEVTQQNAKQAVLAFNGDVYDGLAAKELSEKKTQLVARAPVHTERFIWRSAAIGLDAALSVGDGHTIAERQG